jgi:hypothetical protein
MTRCSVSPDGIPKASKAKHAAVTVHVDVAYPAGMPNEPDGVILPEERRYRKLAITVGGDGRLWSRLN